MSLHLHRSSTASTAPILPSRIALIDNTAPSRSHSADSSYSSGDENAHRRSRKETLRRTIAERRYKRWSREEPLEEPAAAAAASPSDPRAKGLVVDRFNGTADGEEEEVAVVVAPRGRAREIAEAHKGIGQKRKNAKEKEVAEVDVLYENQRGWFLCGIPLFSSKSLLHLDPSPWQNALFHDSAVSIVNAQVPDPSWVWDWDSWYVDMTSDVDEEGWSYSFSFSPVFAWHGNHVWFHSFVRRRRWLRRRVKLPPSKQHDTTSSPEGSVRGGAGHNLNRDYFTIHSQRGSSTKRRSVLDGGSSWDAASVSSLQDAEIPDIPSLLKRVKRARLDREKIEATLRFVADGGEELAYLAENVPALMAGMIFQASRRQLLAYMLEYLHQYEEGKVPAITINLSPSPPLPRSSAASPSSSSVSTMEKEVKEDSPEQRERKLRNLKMAVQAADDEVRKMEFWSDVKDVVRKSEELSAEPWGDQGIGGPSVGNEKVFGGAGNGGAPVGREMVNENGKGEGKGKGKEVQR